MRTIRTICVGLVFILFSKSVIAEGAPSLETIRDAFASARAQVQSVRLQQEAYLGLSSFDTAPEQDQVDYHYLFERAGVKIKTHVVSYRRSDSVPREAFAYYDGEITKVYMPTGRQEGGVSKGLPRGMKFRPIALPWWMNVWEKPLVDRINEDEVVVESASTIRDGRTVWTIRGKCIEMPDTLQYRIYLDQELNWMPRAIEHLLIIDSKMQVLRSVRMFDYKDMGDGIWIPQRIEEEGQRDGEILTRNLFLNLAVEVNISIPDETFEFEFPPGTEIHDETIDMELPSSNSLGK